MGICCMALETQTGALYQPRVVGWGVRWEGGSKGRGYMYTYGWFMLRFDRRQQNSVKQLSFNKNLKKGKKPEGVRGKPISDSTQLLINPSNQIRSVAQSCPTLCNPMNRSTPGLPVHHQLPEFTQTHIHRVSDAIQPSHPLLSPSPLAPNPSQDQSLFQWVNSSHEVAKVLEFQL